MEKIPTLYERDWEGDRSRVVDKQAVELPAGAVATRKWDGTAARVHLGRLWKRYDLKPGRKAPEGFEVCGLADEKTGHWPGWVPVGDGPEDKWYREALGNQSLPDGTYELCGPKVQGNPEGLASHELIPHGAELLSGVPTGFEALRAWLTANHVEGIVWWSLGAGAEPIAKIKRRDFGLPWPPAGGREMSECPYLRLTPSYDGCLVADGDGVPCNTHKGRTSPETCYRFQRARAEAAEKEVERLKQERDAADEDEVMGRGA